MDHPLRLPEFLALLCLAVPQDRAPVPDAVRLKKAQTEVREVFRADYAKKSPAERKAFALKLLQNAVDTCDDPAARYVLLKEAAAQAALAADFPTGFRAVDELAFSFAVEPISLKLSLLTEAAKAAGRAPEEQRALAEAWLLLQAQAV